MRSCWCTSEGSIFFFGRVLPRSEIVEEVENARKHLLLAGLQPDSIEFRELQAVERHLDMCAEVWKVVDWKSALKECDTAFIEGANASSFVNSY
ncbi:hypothetical protein ZIOFF_024399 [Zingiber officinale]|uniref:Uncharacterized protein n=1 Tax=Zingiber officinale TaxID=94328 RepID=A0A8J5GU73_ZINOF|nr:hypothetical protein ZIOFF_024399 [Zingiber officinale]